MRNEFPVVRTNLPLMRNDFLSTRIEKAKPVRGLPGLKFALPTTGTRGLTVGRCVLTGGIRVLMCGRRILTMGS
jgi:hypothetical protein